MIRTIIVDDEHPALDRFTRILGEDKRLSIVGAFTSPSDALAYVRKNKIDVAFLDIEMPGMNGLELMTNFLKCDPQIKIIFVTAYASYAVDAFKLHAFGYLVKPIERSELKEQIDYLCTYFNVDDPEPKKKLYVHTLGDFRCSLSTQEFGNAIKWKTLKAEELFALLIHYRGVPVPKDVLIDKLWPDAEPEKSANLFRVTCTYIRNTMTEHGFNDALIRELNKYKLNMSLFECDAYDFEDQAEKYLSLSEEQLRVTLSLYKGEYFQSMPYDWTMQKRVLLETHFKNLSHKYADICAESNQLEKAYGTLLGILAFDPYDYNTAIKYVMLKIKNGDTDTALHFYREFSSRLVRETGDTPPSALTDIFK